MAQVDKVQVQSTTYDIAQSSSATFAGTSNDNTAPSSWTDVDKLVSGETNGSIFTKISKMFSNIRWLYNQLGTTDYSGTGASTVSAALAALQGGKAAASHSHTVSSLPVSSTQVNSSAYIPTSSLIYSMNQTLTSLNDACKLTPNDRFEYKSLGTWSSTSQVDTFLSTYTHANGYNGISVGNYVTIQDGTYNKAWLIAGFDTEYNRGDTVSGYGITMIPIEPLFNAQMNSSNTTAGGYYGSAMRTSTLPTVATNLKKVLGSHLLSRRVLLSNSINSSASSPAGAGWTGTSNGWTWYSEYLTLMSEVQVYGSSVFGGGFDVGEACQKLPIFNFIHYNEYSRWHFWLRAVASSAYFANAAGSGDADYSFASASSGVRPLLYLG